VAALAGPNTYTLALPRRFKCSPTVNVDHWHPKPYFPRGPSLPASDLGQEGEYVVTEH
jgi:hypothetical protein